MMRSLSSASREDLARSAGRLISENAAIGSLGSVPMTADLELARAEASDRLLLGSHGGHGLSEPAFSGSAWMSVGPPSSPEDTISRSPGDLGRFREPSRSAISTMLPPRLPLPLSLSLEDSAITLSGFRVRDWRRFSSMASRWRRAVRNLPSAPAGRRTPTKTRPSPRAVRTKGAWLPRASETASHRARICPVSIVSLKHLTPVMQSFTLHARSRCLCMQSLADFSNCLTQRVSASFRLSSSSHLMSLPSRIRRAVHVRPSRRGEEGTCGKCST
mmetsp:Transcript_40202/g.87868  ORF Transcript_40202/g.87868 Transcript_40202/m.87868 type:complete len:274 (+) Transcript_40202:457-1278(+)